MPDGNEKLYATRYKLVLPSEQVQHLELIREQRLLEERANQPEHPKRRFSKQK